MFALQYDEQGNWLDSPILIESVGTHEGPEYAEDLEASQQLFASLEGICQYQGTLKRLGGINQHYAIEAYEYIPGWEQKVPRTYYSEHVSQVQYQFTQEGLLKSFWNTLKALWQKLCDLIKRVFYRLIGKKPTSGGPTLASLMGAPMSQSDVREAEEHVKIQQYGIRKKKSANERFAHTVTQMQQKMQSVGFVMEVGAVKKEYFSLNQLLDDLFTQLDAPEIYRKFYFTTDPLWRDMITHGPYTSYLTTIAQHLDEIVDSIDNKIHSMMTALDMVKGPDGQVTHPVLQSLASGERKVTLGDGKHTVAEILHILRDKRRDWIIQSHEAGSEREDYTLFSQKTLYYWSTDSIEKMLEGILKATPRYAILSEAASKMGGLFDKARQHFDESDLGHTIRQATENVISEATAASSLLMDLEAYLNQHRVFVDRSHALVGYFMREIQPYLTQFGNDRGMSSVVQSLTTIMSELKD